MSIRFPDTNIATTTTGSANTACGLDVPRAAFPKFTTGGSGVFGFFFRVPESIKDGAQTAYVFTHAAGTVRSSMLKVDLSAAPNDPIPLDARLGFGGGATARVAISETGFATVRPGRAYLYMVVYLRDTETPADHFSAVLCEVGSATPTIVASGQPTDQIGQYLSRTSSADEIVQHVAVNSLGVEGFWGCVSDLFRLDGVFPHTDFVPDAGEIAAIADGSTPVADLDTVLTGGQKLSWYPLAGPADLDNAWAAETGATGSNPMTVANADAAKLRELYHGPPLQPAGLTPPGHLDAVAGIAALADTDAPMVLEGGSYDETLLSGTVAAVEARIVDATTGAALAGHDWFTLDAAPAAGSFAGLTRAGVAKANAWYQVQYRLLDAGSAVLAAGTAGALRGVGVRIVQCGQSVVKFLWDASGANSTGATVAVADGVRACWIYASPEPSRNDSVNFAIGARHFSPGVVTRPGDGATAYVNEIALVAGCPVQIDLLAIQGHTLGTYLDDNDTELNGPLADPPDGYTVMSGFVADIAAATPPDRYILMQMMQGDVNVSTWKDKLEGALFDDPGAGWLGFPHYFGTDTLLFSMIGPGSRGAAGSNQDVTQGKRFATAEFIAEQPLVRPGSSLLPMHLLDTAHPDDAAEGGRRLGLMLGWGVLFNLGYAEGGQVTIREAILSPDGTACALEFGYL